MSSNGRIRIGVVGCGYWGINYVRVFGELADSIVTHVCDQRQERLQLAKQRFHPGPIGRGCGWKACNSVEEMLDEHKLDAVVVATPATAHYEVTKKCLEHGKHVLVEKPITTSSSEAAELASLAQTQNLILMVGHTFVFNAGVRAIKRYLDSKALGNIYYLHATRTNLGPIRSDVNAIWDLAPHDVSIFDYLLGGEPNWVSAVGGRVLGNCREDVGFITLGYPGGIVGNIHVSWADPNKVREVVVVGSEMRIVFNDMDAQERVRVFNKGVTLIPPETDGVGEFHFRLHDGDIISPWVESSEPLKNQAAHFLTCIREQTAPISDGAFALRVVRVMEAIDHSIQQKGTPQIL